ncbi:MAG: hypothetical protein L3J05_04180 [Robiginitomaculum sp.]|nr:hypothetical protein [Robiginitomaculum sp.]
MKPLLLIVFIGFIAGTVLAVLVNTIPALDNLIPDAWETLIIAIFVGGTINILLIRRSRKSGNNNSK